MTVTVEQDHARRDVTVVNPWGMHARTAMRFVQTSLPFHAEVTVACDGSEPVDGKEVMSLLTLGAPCGATLAIAAVGDDAHEAVETLCRLVEEGFGEGRSPEDTC